MTSNNQNDTTSQDVSLREDFVTGNILDHLDKLEPAKGGKYICPVCGGNDLSINKESGAVTCYTNECSWQSIMDEIAPLPPPTTGDGRKKPEKKLKSKTQKDKDAIQAEVLIDAKVTEIFYEIECDAHTLASARVGLSTWCKEHGYNAYAAGKLLDEKLKTLKDTTGWDDDELAPLLLRDYQKIEREFGNRLRYNTLFKQIELDEAPFDPAMGKIELVVTHKLKLKSGRDDIGDCLVKIAKQNEYHPVRQYLDRVHGLHGNRHGALSGLTAAVLGTADPIHSTIVIKFLISAVARVYEPGCQVDTALILQGKQGYGKSSFFRVLASPEWFDDSFGNASDKDERLKLHSAWLLEWAELETIFKRRDVAAVKAFMTTKIDRIRPPYGRSVEFMPRSSVFCGTTNQQEFLSDSTGNRRFWVVPVSKPIDCEALEEDRDKIWAAAVSLYKKGFEWWLSPEEEAAMCSHRSMYESSDAWEDEVLDFIEGRTECTIQQILEKLGITIANQDKRSQLRVREILTRANWQYEANPVYRDGKRVRIWKPQQVLP